MQSLQKGINESTLPCPSQAGFWTTHRILRGLYTRPYRDIDEAHCILDAKFEEDLNQFIKPFTVCSPTTVFSAKNTRKVDLVRVSLKKKKKKKNFLLKFK